MLSAFEGLLVAVVGDLLAARPGLAVVQAGGTPAPLAAGDGLVGIGITGATPDPDRGFALAEVLPPVDDPRQVRVVPLLVGITVNISRRAAATGDQGLLAARQTLLEDLTMVVHALDDPRARTGAAVNSDAPDPGFRVGQLDLVGVTISEAPLGDVQQAAVTYLARLLVWPPGQDEQAGTVTAVDALLEALPLNVTASPPTVAAGGTASVRIRGLTGRRLADPATGATEPMRIAVGVASQLPPANRGSVTSGTPASRLGFRVVTVTEPETVVEYSAPAGPLGVVRHEDVIVHLAVLGDGVGIRLGSVLVPLVTAP